MQSSLIAWTCKTKWTFSNRGENVRFHDESNNSIIFYVLLVFMIISLLVLKTEKF
jgi:hypothetical protein